MSKIKEGRNCVIFVDVGDRPDCAYASELAKMNDEETDDTESGYASMVCSQEKDTWTPDDAICLSSDNLDMGKSMM
ncbi:hypothetical protein DPMN_138129 [Dreissena polymorpha]|uniref:Uncharacterized protein n=1 Tax=Dreissena polymorpha TaxID=45954 RepID=A0A9D4JEC5_DREPO|nr:hypothetical protein DPMN_138129 [Dreissena polymorpha]